MLIPQETGCDWGVWISRNVSNIPKLPFAYARQPLTSISGLVASAVRMATDIDLTECRCIPRSHYSLILSLTRSADGPSATADAHRKSFHT